MIAPIRPARLLPLILLAQAAFAAGADPAQTPATPPIFDAHVHYSHDAWANLPPADAIAILRKAGIKRALVSSSGDEGTQRLVALAPDLILPSLRPYRTRADVSTWVRDALVVDFLEDRLKQHRYAAIGEFHLYGADVELPVPKRLVALAKQHKLVLHAHSDLEAIERLFRLDPEARILWAHSGFDRPEKVRELLRKHPNLWCDLAFRNEHGAGGKVPAEWRALFTEFPDRFTVGTDTYTPERWYYIGEHATWSRAWLADLPAPLAERIAWRNAEALFAFWKPSAPL
jgi:Amidohydrolase